MHDSSSTRESVQQYYGKILRNASDLRTSTCCSTSDLAPRHREILSQLEDEIIEKFYGCGSPVPDAIEGCTVLDLGCGTGRDAYLVSSLVGPNGRVIGVDMTEEQLEVARKYIDIQAERFGYTEPNVEFRHGFIEDLEDAGIADNSIDVVISNCVVNLSPDKRAVFSEIFRVLKPGGELYFSDIFAGRRVPEDLRKDPVLYGECLSGAMYVEDFRRLLRDCGCMDYRVVSSRSVSLDDEELERKAGMIDFYSLTIRAFKLDTLEDICEDYGQVAYYLGTIPDAPHAFALDDHHVFETGRPVLVCGNTAAMLSETRFAPHFRVTGDRSVHYGP
ncbi:MAG: methyltransferase domain-containing protein, partial [Chlorobi bacterium]|nr:methyltransferase domain-containing protein [Chlorobiota bacterium]